MFIIMTGKSTIYITEHCIVLYFTALYYTYLSPKAVSSMRLTTPLPNTKLAKMVKRPAIPTQVRVGKGRGGDEGRSDKGCVMHVLSH